MPNTLYLQFVPSPISSFMRIQSPSVDLSLAEFFQYGPEGSSDGALNSLRQS